MTTRRIIEIDLTNSDDEMPRITIRNVLGDITTSQNVATTRQPPRRRRRRSNSETDKENLPPPTTGEGLHKNEIETYCVKCKRKEPMVEPKEMTTTNGRISYQSNEW